MTTVVMPQLGESVMEGTVVRWIARPGQKVERDEPLVEIATDKANTEIPSPSAGVLVEQLAKEGAVVTVGGPLARLDEAATAAAAPAPQAKPAPKAAIPAAPSGPTTAEPDVDANGVRATPDRRTVRTPRLVVRSPNLKTTRVLFPSVVPRVGELILTTGGIAERWKPPKFCSNIGGTSCPV